MGTHQEIVKFTSYSDIIFGQTGVSDILSSVAFSPDGRLLASGSADGTVYLWDVEPYVSIPSAVESEDKAAVSWAGVKSGAYSFALGQNYPNPCNPETWIPYQLAVDADVVIRIYDISGRLIRCLYLGHKPAGLHIEKQDAAYWDGRNQFGEKVSGGIYFYQLKAGKFESIRRLINVQ